MIVKNNYCTYTISGKYSLNTFDCLNNYMWLQRALAITKAYLQIKAGHWFISWYIFTDWISDYFTGSGLESSSGNSHSGWLESIETYFLTKIVKSYSMFKNKIVLLRFSWKKKFQKTSGLLHVLDTNHVSVPIGATVFGIGLDEVKIHVFCKISAQY